MKNLVKKFAKAGLLLKLRKDSMGRGTGVDQIVQIDIRRNVNGGLRDEWFEIYPGHPSNRIEVLNVDLSSKQLVLFVDEPRRTFKVEQKVSNPREIKMMKHRLNRAKTKYRYSKGVFYIHQMTDGRKRHFLMGVDERQLFIAQLRDAVTTVASAKRSLGSTVQFHEGTRKMTPGRQGEWFFVQTTRDQEKVIENLIAANRVAVQYKTSIGQVHRSRTGGNPHTADEIVAIPGSLMPIPKGNTFPTRSNQVFIRGCIRHKDHKTVRYSRWHEVIGNNEGATARGSASGITWID